VSHESVHAIPLNWTNSIWLKRWLSLHV
jgi:hypothetical protein